MKSFPKIQLLQFCCPRNKSESMNKNYSDVDEKSSPAIVKHERPDPMKKKPVKTNLTLTCAHLQDQVSNNCRKM